MKAIKTTPFDVAEYLDSDEAIAEYLRLAAEKGDVKHLVQALGDVAHAKGMTTLAEQTGLGRQNLYRALSGAYSPRVDTLGKVLKALGLRLQVGVAK